jgi:hypothetical protein
MKILLLAILVCSACLYVQAEDKMGTVSTSLQLTAEKAKGAHLRSQANDLVAMVKAKRFAEADERAVELRKAYEATFDTKLKQYTFQSQAEFQEFSKASGTNFEWIDWGYKECLQMQAFIAAERRDFPTALAILKAMPFGNSSRQNAIRARHS